jgi:hypothetical protein
MMSQDHLEGDDPRHSGVEKQFLYAIYSRYAQAASVTAADPQLAERHGGDCDDVEAFAKPPTSNDRSYFLTGKMEPVLSGTADARESIEIELGILIPDEESSSE